MSFSSKNGGRLEEWLGAKIIVGVGFYLSLNSLKLYSRFSTFKVT